MSLMRQFIATQSCRMHFSRVLPGSATQLSSAHLKTSATGGRHPYLAIRNAFHTTAISHNKPATTRYPTRGYATATIDTEPGSSRSHAILVTTPKSETLDPDEDVALLSPEEARMQITERAAEKLRSISVKEHDSSVALRIAVESGGCHGYQYKMELTSERAPDDYQFAHATHRDASIVVDAVSLGLLKGSTIDYATELIGSSFRVVDNPQAKGNGCGCGISWEANF